MLYCLNCYITMYYVILMFMAMCPTTLENPVVLCVSVLVENVLGKVLSLDPLK